MTDQPAQIPLRLAVDEQALTRSQQGVALLSQKLADLRKTATDTGVSVDKATSSLGDGIAKATPLMDRLSAAAEKAAQSAKAASGNWNDLRDSIFSAGGAADQASGKFNVEGLRRTGGALSQLGLGAIGGPVSRIGDVAQIAKEAESLNKTMQNLPGVFGGVAKEGTALAGSLGGVLAVVGPLAVAGGILVGGLALIRKGFEDTDKATKGAIAGLDTYYNAISTGTSKSIKEQIDILKQKKQADDDEAKSLKNAADVGFETAKNTQILGVTMGDFGGRVLTFLAGTGAYGDTLKDTTGRQNELTAESADYQAKIDALTKALQSSGIAANDAKSAMEALWAELDKEAIAGANKVKQRALENFSDQQLVDAGEVDQAKKKRALLAAELEGTQDAWAKLVKTGDKNSIDVQNQLKAYSDAANDLIAEIDKLDKTTIPAAQHTKDLADKLKAADQTIKDRQSAIEAADKEAAKVEEKNQADIATSYGKYKNDITNIEQSSAEKQAEIHKQLADKLVDEARKMVEQAQDALQKLGDKRAELLTNLNRGEEDAQRKAAYDDLTLQIKDQEAAAKSYQDHLNKLEDIRRSAWADEQQALFDRNFVALAKSRLNVAAQMQNENIGFGRSEKDRIQQEQSARQDAQRQRAFEHEQRLIAYQQANQDAVRQYQIQLRDQAIADARMRQQAQIDAQRAIEQDRQKTQAAIQMRTQQELAELKVMQQGGAARVKLAAQIQQQLVSQAMQFLNSSGRNAAFSGIQSGGIYAPATSRTSVQLQQTNNFPANLTNSTALSQLVASHTLSALKQVLV